MLKQKTTEVACGAKQSNKARQQLISRYQEIGEFNQSYVAALLWLGEIANTNKENAPMKSDMLCNVLIGGLRDKHIVDSFDCRRQIAS